MTQNQLIKGHLEEGKRITTLDAVNLFNCFRLGARIHDLRRQGMDIHTRYVTAYGKTFAEYYLVNKLL